MSGASQRGTREERGAAGVVHVVAPSGIDDPANPSGGNIYDRRLCQSLAAAGWTIREHLVGDRWPAPRDHDLQQLGAALRRVPDGAPVIVDGLIASAAGAIMRESARRLSLAPLIHLPFGVLDPRARPGEAATLDAASAVIATSRWTRSWLLRTYRLAPERVAVAEPGVDPAPSSVGSAAGDRLLCVAAALPNKGQDVLIAALAQLSDRAWSCVFAGALDRDPMFAAALRRSARSGGLEERVRFVGPLSRPQIADAYARADLVVVASRHETYGMVITEALARGVPVVATDVGGTRSALGRSANGELPGRLVPPDDPEALAGALRDWLDDASLRERLRAAAGRRRAELPDWTMCAASVSRVLSLLGPRASR